MKVLAGDIGGTKTLLQIAETDGRSYRSLVERRYESDRYSEFQTLLDEFLGDVGGAAVDLAAGCLGVAGPVEGDRAKVTNLPWKINRRELGLKVEVALINDFQAVGCGIEGLAAHDFVTLQAGEQRIHGIRALIGAGTGLGQAIMAWDGEHYRVLPTEGGHVDFAPTDVIQDELLQFLRAELGRVSYESVVSGPGLARIYRFLHARERSGGGHLGRGDDPAVISTAALADSDPIAARALELFIRIYGAQAGNFALSTLATGGVYIAGGIAPKIIDRLRKPDFLQAFRAKAPMTHLLEKMPVQVIMNAEVGLIGAVLTAARLGERGAL